MAIDEKDEVVYSDETSIVSTGQTKDERPAHDILGRAQEGSKLSDIYDHFQKIVYVCDESLSMAEKMAGDLDPAQYIWTPEAIKHFRPLVEEAARVAAHFDMLGLDDDDEIGDEEEPEEVQVTDEDVKRYVLEHRLNHGSDAPKLERNPKFIQNDDRKYQVVRQALAKFVEKRFARYPDAQIGVFGFGSDTRIACRSGSSRDEVLNCIRSLDATGGGTNITLAVTRAVNDCQRYPSTVGAHHIILVTDGEDYGATAVRGLLDKMKAGNIVFDFIYIKTSSQDSYPEVVRTLQYVCNQTGGEYNAVTSATEFEEKFLQVSSRLALPPARV